LNGNRLLGADVVGLVTSNRLLRATRVTRPAVALVGAMLLVTSCANPNDRSSEPVSLDGWSGRQILCGYRGTDDPLTGLGAGQVLELGVEPAALLRDARCADADGSGGPGAAPRLIDGRSYFVFNTGADRFDITLVSVDTSVDPTSLGTELTVVGEGCGSTDEYRGQLMLLIEAPAASAVPDVSMREVPLSC
jgi:hypothetical protein